MVSNVNILNPTVKDIIDSMSKEEKKIMYEIVGAVIGDGKLLYSTLNKFYRLDLPKQTVILYLISQANC
jgi:hypothetical protein